MNDKTFAKAVLQRPDIVKTLTHREETVLEKVAGGLAPCAKQRGDCTLSELEIVRTLRLQFEVLVEGVQNE